jgi:hypothetical protein
MLWNAQVGGDIYNFTRQYSYGSGRSADLDQAGKTIEFRKSADYYAVLHDANNLNSHFVEDGTFIRLRELAVSYTFDRARLSNLFGRVLHEARISFVARNLLTITDYTGLDPEVGTTFNISGGLTADPTLYRFDNFGYPNYRTFTAKLELQF